MWGITSFYILVRFTNTIRFSLTFSYNEASQHFSAEIHRQRAMNHEGSACLKGCLGDVWPVTALTEISLYTAAMNHYSVTIHNLQMVHVWVHLAYCHVLCVFSKQLKKVTIKIVRSVHPSIPLQGTGQLSSKDFHGISHLGLFMN